MRQRGVVIQKTGQEVAVQILESQETCSTCGGGCGACVSLTPGRAAKIVKLADRNDQYAVGDEVIVEAEFRPLIKAVAALYTIPFVFLFLGYALTNRMLQSDPLAGLGAVAGLLTGGILARFAARRFVGEEQELKIVAKTSS